MKKVYLDQCAVSNLCLDPARSWRETKMGAVIDANLSSGAIEVWVSPSNVLETLLCADYDEHGNFVPSPKAEKRVRIARTLLDLSQAKRMSASYEYLLVGEFMEFLRQLAPDCLTTDAYYRRFREHNQQMFLGILALLVAYPELDRPAAVEQLLRSKVSSQLLHSKFSKDPDGFVEKVIDCAREFRLTDKDVWEETDKRSLSELKSEIDSNLSGSTKLSGSAKTTLQKNKAIIAASYGAAEIGQCLDAVFKDMILVMLTFNVPELRENWDAICAKINKKISLPKSVFEADDTAIATDPMIAAECLGHFFRHVARGELLSPQVVQQVVIGELEMCLNRGEIPTGGLGFDSEHAAMLNHVNVFVTSDTRLENLAKRAAKLIQGATTGQWDVAVVSNPDQLAAAINR